MHHFVFATLISDVTSVPHSEPYFSVTRRNMTGLSVSCRGLPGVVTQPVAASMEVLQSRGRCKQLERFQNMQLDHFKRIPQTDHCLRFGV